MAPPVNIDHLTADQLDDWNERSAILEYDGGLSRAEAERLALELVTCATCEARRKG